MGGPSRQFGQVEKKKKSLPLTQNKPQVTQENNKYFYTIKISEFNDSSFYIHKAEIFPAVNLPTGLSLSIDP